MQEEHIISCWYCTAEYDLISAEWCKCSAEQPSKVCPYCLKCFCDAGEKVRTQIWAQAPEKLKNERSSFLSPKDKLGDLLISKGLLTTTQLMTALKTQKETKKKLGEVLTSLNFITEQQIISALSDQYDLVHIELDANKLPDKKIFNFISFDFCLKYTVAPIDLQEVCGRKILYVAITSPPNKDLISKINEIAGIQIYPYSASSSDILNYLNIIKDELDIKPRTLAVTSTSKVLEELIQKTKKFKANKLVFSKNRDNECHIEIYLYQHRLTILRINAKNFEQIKQYVLSSSGMDHEKDFIADFCQIMKIMVFEKNLTYWIDYSSSTQMETIVLNELDKRSFLQGISDWNLAENDMLNLKTGMMKLKGLTVILGPSVISNYSALYSLHYHLLERGFSITALQGLLPFEVDNINYVSIKDIQTFQDLPVFELDLRTSFITVDRDPVSFFSPPNELHTLMQKKHIIAIANSHDIDSYLHNAYENEFLNKDFIENINLILCVKPINKICTHCRKQMSLNPRMLKSLGIKDDEIEGLEAFKGHGCKKCSSTGFFREEVLYDVLCFSGEIKKAILSKPVFDIDNIKMHLPSSDLRKSGLNLVKNGIITLSDMLKHT